jgi:hypothetical protein
MEKLSSQFHYFITTYLNCRATRMKELWRQHENVRLIIYCFTSCSRIFHLRGDVTINGEGLQNLGLCSALMALEQGGIFIVPHLLWHGVSVFSGLIRRTAPFSRLLRHTRGCGRPILTRILSGMKMLEIPFLHPSITFHLSIIIVAIYILHFLSDIAILCCLLKKYRTVVINIISPVGNTNLRIVKTWTSG